MGTSTLLNAARKQNVPRYIQISTDEVYGSLSFDDPAFTEQTALNPRNPYSAAKAGGDMLVLAHEHTFGINACVTRCSNNYGPYQFPEKLLPVMILNAAEGKNLPVYGDGKNVRDWLQVTDHCRALLAVAEQGRMGETYNIGGNCERSNLQVVEAICRGVATYLERDAQEILDRIVFVTDRPGHDFRYAIDSSKLQDETDWAPSVNFEEGLQDTIAWYLENGDWIEQVRSGAYRQWMELNYNERQEA